MKGRKTWFFAACLCAALPAGTVFVSAEEAVQTAETLQLTLLDTQESWNWIYASPAVQAVYTDTGAAALVTLDGTRITEPVYDMWEFSYNYGYFNAMEADNPVNGRGVLAEDGSVVIPFEYGAIDILSPEWAVAYTSIESSEENYNYVLYDETEHYYLYETAYFYYLPDRACAGSLSCDEFMEAAAAGYSINIQSASTGLISTYDRQFNLLSTEASYIFDDTYAEKAYTKFYENGLCGLKDSTGAIVLPAVYSGLEGLYGDYIEIYQNGRCGLADLSGNLVIPAEYDYIRINYTQPYDIRYGEIGYNAQGYFCVVQDGKIGYVNESGEVTCAPVYTEEMLDQSGASALYTDAEGHTCILAADGTETVLADYEEIYAEEFSSGMLYTVYDEAYLAGLIDWHGNEILPCEYYNLSISGDGRYLLAFRDYDGMAELYRITYPGEEMVPEAVTQPETEIETTTEVQIETTTEAEVETTFDNKQIAGFITISHTMFGSTADYVELVCFQVSEPYRGLGIGKVLFGLATEEAKTLGADKLYISAHSSKESQAVYKALGCVHAKEINLKLAEEEPCDVQLEYDHL